MVNKKGPPDWIVNTVILVILGVWIANFMARIFVEGYSPPESADAVMLVVAGFLFSGKLMQDDDDDDDPPKKKKESEDAQ